MIPSLLCIDCSQRPAHARQRCAGCYARYRKSSAFVRVNQKRGQACLICGKPAVALELCDAHYARCWRAGISPQIRAQYFAEQIALHGAAQTSEDADEMRG